MSDVLTFCKDIIETVRLEVTETQKELDTKLKNEEREEINTTLRKNDKINLQQRKSKKFTCLKFKPTRPLSETAEFE